MIGTSDEGRAGRPRAHVVAARDAEIEASGLVAFEEGDGRLFSRLRWTRISDWCAWSLVRRLARLHVIPKDLPAAIRILSQWP